MTPTLRLNIVKMGQTWVGIDKHNTSLFLNIYMINYWQVSYLDAYLISSNTKLIICI